MNVLEMQRERLGCSICKKIAGTPKSRQRSNLLTRRNPKDLNVLLQPNQWCSELTARVGGGEAQVLKNGEMGPTTRVHGGGDAIVEKGETTAEAVRGYLGGGEVRRL
jgi:hypothetical protein